MSLQGFRGLWVLALAARLLAGALPAASYPALRAEEYVVSSGHEDASRAGAEVLAAGGDVTDAAVAVMAALGVVNPYSSGLGGGCFLVVHRAAEGRTYVVDAREVAPRRAHRDMFLVDGEPRGELSRWGGLAVGVPGEVRGMEAIHARWGKLPWARTLRPAAALARRGVEVHAYAERLFEMVDEQTRRYPETRRVFYPEGRPPRIGERLANPDLARTLEALGEQGPDWFYQGAMARDIVWAVEDAGGVLELEDLREYRPRWREPVRGRFRGHEVVSMPPPSSGGAVLIEILQTLEHFPLERMGQNSSAYLHHLGEAMKRAFADRAVHMGDPEYVDVPLERLLSPGYARSLARSISPFRARAVEPRGTHLPEDGGTSHFSIMDAAGNVVAGTTTINYVLGSLVTVPGRGVVLNDEMDDFSIAPGVPNAYGLVGGEANAVAPGKKPLSSMSPTLVFRGGRPVLVAGASGGPRIITATLQVILNQVVFGLDLQEAVNRPRVHHQWRPDELWIEEAHPADVRRALEARGHTVVPKAGATGRVQPVGRDGRWLLGASDPRKGGRPAGR